MDLNSTLAAPALTETGNARHHALGRDLRGGLVTLLGSLCIAALIPAMLNGAGGAAITSVAATALACVIGTLLFAGVTRLPFAVGPGIVPTAIVASYLAAGIPLGTVLGIELIAGLIFAALVATGLISRWVRRMPALLKTVGQVAIGLYLLHAALRAGGLLGEQGLGLKLPDLSAGLFLLGVLVAVRLASHRTLGGYAALIGVALVAAGSLAAGLVELPALALAMPELSLGRPDLLAAVDWRYADEIAILLYVVVVDVVATFEALAGCEPELRADDGRLRQLDRAMQMSAAVFVVSPFLGTAPMLVFFESLGGVLSGARTVRAALVVAAGFALVVVAAPLATAIPGAACAVALAFVGWSITRHAAAALPRAAQDADAARLAWTLSAVAVALVLLAHSLALALFALFATYPLAARLLGQPSRGGDMATAGLAGLLIVTMLI